MKKQALALVFGFVLAISFVNAQTPATNLGGKGSAQTKERKMVLGTAIVEGKKTTGKTYTVINLNTYDSVRVRIVGVEKKVEQLPGGIVAVSEQTADANGNVGHVDLIVTLAPGEQMIASERFCIHTVGIKIYRDSERSELIPVENEHLLKQ